MLVGNQGGGWGTPGVLHSGVVMLLHEKPYCKPCDVFGEMHMSKNPAVVTDRRKSLGFATGGLIARFHLPVQNFSGNGNSSLGC